MSASAKIILLLLVGGILTGAASASEVRVTVEGGSGSQRRIATETADRWADRFDGKGSLEALTTSIGSALVRDGWGEGEIAAAIDTVAGEIHYKVTLQGMKPSRLDEWRWDSDTDHPVLKTGTWDPVKRTEQIDRILHQVRENGRPFASIQILEAEETDQGFVVRARLDEGPLLRLGEIVFEGRGGTSERYLSRVAGLEIGDPIRPSEADAARDRLERTGLFASVDGPWLRSGSQSRASLVYRMIPLPQNRAEGALGYDGRTSTLSGFVNVELGNLFGSGRRFLGAWERFDSDRSRLNLAYREPYVAGLPVSVEVGLAQYLEDSTWTEDEARGVLLADLGGGLTARAGLGWQRTILSAEQSSRTTRLSTIIGLSFDDRTEAGTRGGRIDLGLDTGSLKTSPRVVQGEGMLARVSLEGERNFLFGSRGQLRVELQSGWVEGPDSLPRPEAIGLGGGSSLRGYAEHQFRVLRHGLVRIEGGVRILPEGNRAYLFYDGALFRSWTGGSDTDRHAYGAGVRVRGAAGWVRLDYGIASGEPLTSGRLHFRLETRF